MSGAMYRLTPLRPTPLLRLLAELEALMRMLPEEVSPAVSGCRLERYRGLYQRHQVNHFYPPERRCVCGGGLRGGGQRAAPHGATC